MRARRTDKRVWPLAVAFVATVACAEPRHFDIGPQLLLSALREFGLQSGEPIVFRSESIASQETRGVQGTLEPKEALRELLTGTQLSFKRRGNGFVVLYSPAQPQPAAGMTVDESSGSGVDAEGDDVAEVRITASRVVRSGFMAPTPTTVISSTQLERRGATNVGQVLNENPAFRATTTPLTNGVRAIFPGALYADLRGLGASRTLVLVNGKRFVPQITTGLPGYQIDLNQIPSLLVERAEVVTGGASAQWGSDAVAGVVNLILQRNVQGLKVEVQGGRAEAGDNREVRLGMLAGTQFAEGRGQAQIAADFIHNDGVGDVYTRAWGRHAWQVIPNPCPLAVAVSKACPSGGNGQPVNLILPDVRYSTATRGGLINGSTVTVGGVSTASTLLRGIQFGPGGQTLPFIYGNFVGSQHMQSGGSNEGLNFNTSVGMQPAGERRSVYARLSYSMTESVEAFVDASYAFTRGVNTTLPARDMAIKIYSDNAFLPESVRGEMLANDITSLDLGRSSGDVGFQEGNVTHETPRVVLGLEGATDAGWSWDGAYTFGQNRYSQHVANDRVIYRFRAATDAVWWNGRIVCRSSIPGAVNPEGGSAAPPGAPAYDLLATGCVPLNVFGDGSASDDASRFVTDTLWSNTRYQQQAASLNISGEPWQAPAGLVSVAAGVEWRSEEQRTRVDPQADLALYESTNAKSFAGRFSVREAYLETVVPLFSGKPFVKSLELNGAVRATSYSSSGGVATWKIGATWTPVPRLLFRGAWSRDIRAPNLFELNTPAVSTVMNVRFRNAQPAVETLTGGNAALQPEKANTLTLGVAWSDAEAGLQASVDYFNIDVTGAIAALTSQQIADFCTAGQQMFCDRIEPPTHPNAVYTVRSPFINFNEVQRTGFDTALSWRLPLARWLPGEMSFGFNGTYMAHDRENAGNGFIERAGQSSIAPRVVAAGALAYSLGRVWAFAQVRHVSRGRFDNSFVEGVQINDNSVSGATYVNLSAAIKVSPDLQVFGVVNNALNRDPPIVPASFGLPTSAVYFDTIGRSYRLGLRYRF